MIRDLKDTLEEELPAYDLCIVGSGPSGMALCAELAASGLRIAVIESGNEERSSFASDLRLLEQSGIAIRDDSRERILGGASETWGGLSAPLDGIDFEKRPYAREHEGWPFAPEELGPYLERAAVRFRFAPLDAFKPDHFLAEDEIGRTRLDAMRGDKEREREAYSVYGERLSDAGNEAVRQTRKSYERKDLRWHNLEPKIFLAVRPPFQFGKELRYVFSRPALDLVVGATVTELIPDAADSRKIAALSCRGEKTQSVEVRARAFVLAAGAIENSRILLNSKRVHPNGAGNEHGQVGRYFMNHPKGYVGRILLYSPYPAGREYFWKKQGYLSGYAGLRLSEDVQRARGVLNAYVRLEEGFPWTKRHEMDVMRNFLRCGRLLVATLVRRKKGAVLAAKDLMQILPRTLRALPGFIVLTLSRASYGKNPSPTALLPRYFLEMEPRSSNRITLSEKRDAFGMPVPRVHHALSELDRISFEALQDTLASECEELGIGELVRAPGVLPSEDASHHLGGTRMGANPATSVVDGQLRVHSLDNLFIAGGSVFPTSGCANPTMVMVALSLRLARHLQDSFFKVKESPDRAIPKTALPTLIIGAGKRSQTDILPVLESLPGLFDIQRIFGRTPRAVFGNRVYEVSPFSAIQAADIKTARVLYISVPAREVSGVLAALTRYDCSHCDLIVPTPVLKDVASFSPKFRRVCVEEDSVFLPWIAPLKRASSAQGELGPIKKILIDRCAYRYHAFSLVKALCGDRAPGRIQRGIRLGNCIWLWCNGVRVLLKEPRDYAQGRLRIEGARASATDRVEPGALVIECMQENGRCSGFCVGKESELLSPEESALFGPARQGDTIITRMHDCKRVGLRRFLQALAREKEPWPLSEGRNDTAIDGVLHGVGVYLGGDS